VAAGGLADRCSARIRDRTGLRRVFEGSSIRFIGGHLNGYVGNNVRGGTNFEIHGISCSHN
jgi:hypothetical protein